MYIKLLKLQSIINTQQTVEKIQILCLQFKIISKELMKQPLKKLISTIFMFNLIVLYYFYTNYGIKM